MKLADYLVQENLSPADFARQIDVQRMAVHRYLRGQRFPRPVILQRIKQATAGRVTADDFVAGSGGSGRDDHTASAASPGRDGLYPWRRESAETQQAAEEAFRQMMHEPKEGTVLSSVLATALETLGPRAAYDGKAFRLDGRIARPARLVSEANRIRLAEGSIPLRYPGVDS